MHGLGLGVGAERGGVGVGDGGAPSTWPASSMMFHGVNFGKLFVLLN